VEKVGPTFKPIGRSGELLVSALGDLGIDEMAAYINVVRCHPIDNKLPAKAARLCATFLRRDIERLDPEMVLLLGKTAFVAVLGNEAKWAGTLWEYEFDGTIYAATWHPAYVLRRPNLEKEWRGHIALAASLL